MLLKSSLHRAALALTLLGALGCREEPPPTPVPLSVLAAASLDKYAAEAAEAFEAVANVEVEVRSGGTHELAAELASSRSADLFLAAGVDGMDRLEKEGVIVPGSRWEAVGNRMVILGREEARYPPVRFVEVASLGFRRFVVPDPRTDPAGHYARRWLETVGARGDTVWQELEARRETVGNVAEVLFRSPDLGIRYSFALVDRPGRPPEALELLAFLRSPTGIDLLQRNGFLVER
jgi:ABC-type molybdate transport system substrate-binding protein